MLSDNVEVTVAPAICTAAGLNAHVGAKLTVPDPVYVTWQVRFTVPENPFDVVTLT